MEEEKMKSIGGRERQDMTGEVGEDEEHRGTGETGYDGRGGRR
jgi:hypothetical protein